MAVMNLGAAHYWLDHLYGLFMHRLRLAPPFFSRGWGGSNLVLLEHLTRQLFAQGLAQVAMQQWPPVTVRPKWRTIWVSRNAVLEEGVFVTPCDEQLKRALPVESHLARVQLLTPRHVPRQSTHCVLHLAGTGDHGFSRRLKLGGPLLKDNIATMVLEREVPGSPEHVGVVRSPFYGDRRPHLQFGAKLRWVSDLFLLGRATIEEARSLLYWMDRDAGFANLGVCGLSMGGVHAAMVGSLHPTPLAVLPLLAPHSAAVAFCEGILQHGTAWDALLRDAVRMTNLGMSMEEVRERMRKVLSLTDVTRFSVPKNPRSVIVVAATDDGFIPKHSALELQKAWPGAEVRWVTGGHVSSFILHNKEFQRAIKDALQRLP